MVYDPALVPLINAHLPAQIRVLAMIRVTRGFHARKDCLERTYEYVMPSYALAPPHSATLSYRIDGEWTMHCVCVCGRVIAYMWACVCMYYDWMFSRVSSQTTPLLRLTDFFRISLVGITFIISLEEESLKTSRQGDTFYHSR